MWWTGVLGKTKGNTKYSRGSGTLRGSIAEKVVRVVEFSSRKGDCAPRNGEYVNWLILVGKESARGRKRAQF